MVKYLAKRRRKENMITAYQKVAQRRTATMWFRYVASQLCGVVLATTARRGPCRWHTTESHSIMVIKVKMQAMLDVGQVDQAWPHARRRSSASVEENGDEDAQG